MKPHIRLEKPPVKDTGAPHVVTNDRLIAVDIDGKEADVSTAVTEWHEISVAGDMRKLVVTFVCFDIYGGHEDAEGFETERES